MRKFLINFEKGGGMVAAPRNNADSGGKEAEEERNEEERRRIDEKISENDLGRNESGKAGHEDNEGTNGAMLKKSEEDVEIKGENDENEYQNPNRGKIYLKGLFT